jgi:hypothetical protein
MYILAKLRKSINYNIVQVFKYKSRQIISFVIIEIIIIVCFNI